MKTIIITKAFSATGCDSTALFDNQDALTRPFPCTSRPTTTITKLDNRGVWTVTHLCEFHTKLFLHTHKCNHIEDYRRPIK